MTGLFLSGVWTSVIVTLLYSLTRFKLLLKYLLWNKTGIRGKQVIVSLDSKLQQWKERNKIKNLEESETIDQNDNSIRPRNDTLATMLATESAVQVDTEDGQIITKKSFQLREEGKSYITGDEEQDEDLRLPSLFGKHAADRDIKLLSPHAGNIAELSE